MNATASDPVLSLEHVFVRYGRTSVVEDVSISVERGTVFALLGRNGVGKSSLIRCILGHQRPTRGAVRIFGRSAWATRTAAMARVGVVPEEPDAPPRMNAGELVWLCRQQYDRWDASRVASRLARSGVPQDVPFARLSKGQKGALMLALALGHAPELLVLDDPTLGLDAVARKDLFDELISELADHGTTVFLTSHDLEGIERLANRVAILQDGGTLLNEPLEAVKQRFRRVRLAGPESADIDWQPFETLAVARRDWGSEAVVTNFSEEHLVELQSRAAGVSLEVASLSLEEIFIALVGSKEVSS